MNFKKSQSMKISVLPEQEIEQSRDGSMIGL